MALRVMSLSPVGQFSWGSPKRDAAAVPRLGLAENIRLYLAGFLKHPAAL